MAAMMALPAVPDGGLAPLGCPVVLGGQLPAPGQEAAGSEVAVSGRGADRDARVGALFDQHYRGLCRLATLLLGDPAGAEEVVQEAFVRTYAGWWRIRQPERAQWYLRRAVVNQCRSRQRRRLTEERGNRLVMAGEPYAAVEPDLASGRPGRHAGRGAGSGPEPGPDDPAMAPEVLMVLHAVRGLPPRQREAVVLRYYEDLSEADIADVLGCSQGTVKSQLSKARATLAVRLADLQEGADR